MNAKYIAIALIVLVAIILIIVSFYNEIKKNTDEFTLNRNQIVEIIFPVINDYCDLLENNAKNSGYPTCYFKVFNLSYYEKVDEITNTNSPQYLYKDEDGKIIIKMNIPLIYGQNTRTGHILGNFTLSSSGEIIEKNIPIKGNIYTENGPENIIGYF